VAVDPSAVEPLGGRVGEAAEEVDGEFPRLRQVLGDAEVEHAHAILILKADVLRLDVAVDDAVDLAPAHLGGKIVTDLQHVAELTGDGGGAILGERPAGEPLREIVAGHVLQRHPEERAVLPPLVDRRHLGRHAGELPLERDAVLLRLQHLGIGAVGAHHLERHLPLPLRVPGQVDVAERAAAEKVAELEAAHLLDRQHQVLPLRRGAAGCGAGCCWGGGAAAGARTASARATPGKVFQE
jgi:hypothetical protein